MRPTLRSAAFFLAWAAAGCSSELSPAGVPASIESGAPVGLVDSGASAPSGSSSGATTSGGPAAGSSSGGLSAAPDSGSGAPPDMDSSTTPDASAGATPDAGTLADDSDTPMATDGGVQPSYDGEIPIYYGPDPDPIVQMQCPGDPTLGWTEYKDTFHVERPYTVPINARFSITNGIYNFWVFPNDPAHSPIAHGMSPRTEATYGGLHDMATVMPGTGNASGIGYFTTGMRMYSADVLIESSAAGSIVIQLHTTATGIGPVYLSGGGIPGGMVNTWFNLKIAFDAATLKSQVYINNCPKGTVSGPRGDGHFYFKNGVYHCGNAAGCRDHFKNVHFYTK